MAKAKKNKKKIELDNGQRITVILFVFIMIYLSSFVITYLTKEKVNIYEVYTGSINTNNTYTGIAIRDESVFYSDFSGNINYFLRESERAAVGSIVYTVDETGRVASMIESLNTSDNSMSDINLTIVKNALSNYKVNISDNTFSAVYELKEKLDMVVSDSVNENVINNLDDMIKETASENMFKYTRSTATGIVVYNTDGYENLSVNDLNSSHFDKTNYEKNNLRAEAIVVAGNPVYKLITSEDWKIAIPITNEQIQAQQLADKKVIQIRFIKENITTYANFEIVPTGGGTYGVLSLNKYMVQYAADRFVDIEIISSNSSGLKIPISSIVEKEFFTIPAEYATAGGNKSTIGFLREHPGSDGSIITEYCDVPVYANVDGLYYVDKSDFSYGDSILMTDSTERYTITSVGVLQGVYTVNKGYAVFRRIQIIEQNTEYAIVEKGISYSLSAYDHIVLEGTKVEENQIIY